MKPLVLSVLLLACGLALVTCSPAQFNELIQLSTITYGLANFTNYGCHCGAGTQGLPVDAIDRHREVSIQCKAAKNSAGQLPHLCCHSHDCCYNKVEMYGCNPRVLTYRFYAQGDKIKCVKSRDRCEKMVCECDQKAASCFQKHLFSYSPQFRNLPVASCRAQRPFC
ncbi:phospholipase A2 like otoconin-22-like [Crotalus adamanteus]|uniref:Phospholipase A2 like otoconin-22-like n=1 Tax=Crotalus adamanteus TaxID=8729 RepID=A0AAW1ARB3_CROAD